MDHFGLSSVHIRDVPMTASFSADTTTTTTLARPEAHSQSQSHHVHRRRSSNDSDDELLAAAASTPSPPQFPQRTRMISAPSGYVQHTRSVSVANSQNHVLSRPRLQRPPGLPAPPVPTSFHMAPPPNGVHMNGHSRARSISAFSYNPLSPSPLSTSFQVNNNPSPSNSSSDSKTLAPRMYTSYSAPEIEGSSNGDVNTPLKQQIHEPSRLSDHHIHSRNLSIVFPHPGSLPTCTISELEDGAQEVSVPDPSPVDEEFGSSIESRESFSGNSRTGHLKKPLTPLGQGFTFGSKPPSSILSTGYPSTITTQQSRPIPPPLTVTRTRRGHHHKHSLSHNFFSFLEPGYASAPSNSPGVSPASDTAEVEQNAQPRPVPVSSWDPKLKSGMTSLASYNNGYGYDSLSQPPPPLVISPTFAKALSIINLSLGATLWVSGQQAGSLACTGLGYWVVFDSIGLALSRNFDFGLGSVVNRLDGRATANPMETDKGREAIRRPYGYVFVLRHFPFCL